MRKSNCYAVVSGKGGTGKTTVCAALASALALMGRRVCVVDLDVGLHNLDLALGLQDRALFDLGDVLAARISLDEALLTRADLPGLALLAAPGDYEFLTDPDCFSAQISELCQRFDYCLVDAPAGLGRGFALATMCAGRALVVSTPDTPCMSDSATAAGVLVEAGITDVRLILNRVVKPLIRRKRAFNVDEAMDFVGLPLAGIVMEERAVTAAFNRCEPLMLSKAKAAREFTEIAKRLERIPLRPKF